MDSDDWVGSGCDGSFIINWGLLEKEQGEKVDGHWVICDESWELVGSDIALCIP